MSMSRIENNLILFLDPAGSFDQQLWHFQNAGDKTAGITAAGQITVLSFPRCRLLLYFWTMLRLFFTGGGGARKVLYLNDGLLSCFLDTSNRRAYRAFARNHLPGPRSLRQRVIALLPLVWRSETRFITVMNTPVSEADASNAEIKRVAASDFMFFSNPAGKLLLLRGETLRTGKGEVYKTTSDPDYLPVMEREFETVSTIADRFGRECIPSLGVRFEIGQRRFFSEDYVLGQSLGDVLDALAEQKDLESIFGLMERLDQWSRQFQERFTGNSVMLSSLYGHVFTLFDQSYGASSVILLEFGGKLLAELESVCPSVVPVTAHNDLWPGNIIVTEHGFTAIDWERATECRAPFFDYFWMIAAAAIQTLGRLPNKSHDQALGIRRFLSCGEPVSRYAHRMLILYLTRFGIKDTFLPHLLLLFLMELSVQGFQTLGRQTDMDRFAFAELVCFAQRNWTTLQDPPEPVAS
jgi:hypothetical protein